MKKMAKKFLAALSFMILLVTFCACEVRPSHQSPSESSWQRHEHIPIADDGDCTTPIICSVCGMVLTEANANHIGGEATCVNKAKCTVCGKEYGELAEHEGERIWIKHLKTHYLAYSCCLTQISEAEEHTIVRGVCATCGFNPSIAVSSAEAMVGDTQVDIAISIADNPGIAGLMLTLQYDSNVFELIAAESGEAFGALTFTSPKNFYSGCVFLWDSVEVKDKDVKDGAFLNLSFNILSNAPAGEYSILLKVSAYDNELTPFTLLVQSGKITVKNNI